ncbi:MAG TPA: polysaccharide export protein [Cyanobacteria bacterium UBA11149]|nr:polysaccharide export protein [Cyanobacteria bacterium UBA11367]HBE56707.1 polysaccharide export protein [Cyanobacteria bacterium UBA11366]HBK63006.1 polysaccharide export protein [Cyanobacteria bacterium UBA11166]HBR76339.1 polysaccharide export protein [Cyanobacteria bacterium UBA11159]HBS70393.1 polysaccharide export protein [Cyanobacteria bacterium UBA11153]HBW87581.1 polysaccharide export protein [Cyanobacteria bacterium UBA11149]HCA97169.1 polysaccharide export protein [Cyanobacteria
MIYPGLPQQRVESVVVGVALFVPLLVNYPVSQCQAQLPSVEKHGSLSPGEAIAKSGQRAIALTEASTTQYEPDYTLGGGDRIRLEILEVPQYSGEYLIPPGGFLSLPRIGSVSVQGLTLAQAAQTISSKYNSLLKRPIVSVILVNPRPINVSVSGEVNRPGYYALSLDRSSGGQTAVESATLTLALQQAGGVTLAADIRQVQIRRRQVNGGEKVHTIDLWNLVQTGNQRQNLVLRDGDVVFVPTATSVNLAEAQRIATTGFAPTTNTPRTVAVIGEVNRPGGYVLIGGNTTTTVGNQGFPTVTRAIQLAGGIKPMADIRRISIRRNTQAGGEQIISVDLWQLIQAGDFHQDTVVQDGDTIIIPTATDVNPAEATELADASFSPTTIKVSVVGEVAKPGVVEVPPNTPLNQAILVAGGFDEKRANGGEVALIRLNPDGTVSKRTVPIDLARGINEESNPTLRNNDIIIVDRSNVARVTDAVGTTLSPVDKVLNLFNILKLLGIFF